MRATCLALALLPLAAAAAPGAEGLSLSPAAIELSGSPGQSTTQRFWLRNDTGVPLTFALEARDVVVRSGRREVLPPGELVPSVAATAVFSQRELTVPPGATRSVDLTLTLPPGLATRAVIALFRGTTRLGAGRTGATASLGAILAFSLSDRVSVSAAPLRVDPPGAASNAAFEEALENDGDEPIVVRGVAVVLGDGGEVIARAAFDPRRILPGERVVVRTEHPGELRAGAFRALATFEYAGRTLTRAAELRIP